MTTETSNPAQELHDVIDRIPNLPVNRYQALHDLVGAALDAERRATVERIRTRALALRKRWGAEGLPASLASILESVSNGEIA